MAYTTDLVYAIYGKDKTAGKTLKGVGKDADNAGEQFKRMGKVAATAFLAVGAAAGAFALSAAKAAAEDEKSQKMLAASIKNTTNATDAQIKSTEDFISKMQLTYGVADDKLRPAFATLSRATGDLGESQNLMQTAMDVSAGTGKDLTTVSLALAKAHNGNIGALTRLGIPLDKSIIKNKDFNAALAVLTKTFNGAAKAGADTFAGRMQIVQERLKEAKEQIGYALMPTLETMATYLTETVVPNVQAFVDGLTGVKDKSDGAMASIYNLGEKTRGFFKFLGDNKDFLGSMAKIIGAIFIGAKAYQAVAAMTGALALLRTAFAATTIVAATTAGAEAAATGGLSLVAALPAIAAIAASFGVLGLLASFTNDAPAGEQTALDIKKVKSGKPTDFSGSMVVTTGADAQGGRTVDAYAGNQKTKLYNGTIYTYDPAKKKYYVPDISGGRDYSVQPRALGGAVSRGASYLVGERGPEVVTMGGNGFVTPNNRLGGMGGTTVVVNVAGSVIHEKDLAVTVRDNIAQLMRRRGLNPAILGV
jgi:hypothetical protein